jgi:hypothetical protein
LRQTVIRDTPSDEIHATGLQVAEKASQSRPGKAEIGERQDDQLVPSAEKGDDGEQMILGAGAGRPNAHRHTAGYLQRSRRRRPTLPADVADPHHDPPSACDTGMYRMRYRRSTVARR